MNGKKYRHAFLAVGIVLIIISGRFMWATHVTKTMFEVYKSSATQVEAECTIVEKAKSTSRNVVSGYDVYVTYEYKGETYENVPLEHYEITLIKGDKVNVLVNDLFPFVCTIDYPGPYYNYYVVLQYVILGVGVIFVVLHFYMIHRERI